MIDALKVDGKKTVRENFNEIMHSLPVIHMVESDDYRARLLIKSFNDSDEKGRRLMLQQAAAVAKLCAKDAA